MVQINEEIITFSKPEPSLLTIWSGSGKIFYSERADYYWVGYGKLVRPYKIDEMKVVTSTDVDTVYLTIWQDEETQIKPDSGNWDLSDSTKSDPARKEWSWDEGAQYVCDSVEVAKYFVLEFNNTTGDVTDDDVHEGSMVASIPIITTTETPATTTITTPHSVPEFNIEVTQDGMIFLLKVGGVFNPILKILADKLEFYDKDTGNKTYMIYHH